MEKYSMARHGITQSLLGMFNDCRTEAAYHLDGWDSGRSLAMDFGTAGHLVLENLYRHYSSVAPPPTQGSLVEEACKVAGGVIERWADQQLIGRADPQRCEDVEWICGVLPALIPGYVARYTKDFRSFTWLGVESEFRVEWEGCLLRGKRDGVFTYPRQRKAWLLETKFPGEINERVLNDALMFDAQNLFYLHNTAVGEKLNMAGVLYNMIRRPGLRQGKDESWPSFLARVRKDVTDRPDHYFVRFELSYPAEVMEWYRKELAHQLEEFTLWQKGKLYTTHNQKACRRMGSCRYLRACAQRSLAGYTKREKMFPELEGI